MLGERCPPVNVLHWKRCFKPETIRVYRNLGVSAVLWRAEVQLLAPLILLR